VFSLLLAGVLPVAGAQSVEKPAAPVTDQALASKDREIEELRGLMRSGVRSPAVAQAALARATEERAALLARREQKDSRSADRVLRPISDVA
jgi:hypothetical protein